MGDRILFPTDGSQGADTIVDSVLDLAAHHDATVYVLTVADTDHDSVVQIGGDVVDVLEREGQRIVDETASRAVGSDVDVVPSVVQGSVPDSITAFADREDIDLIVMPTQGRTGLDQQLLGSTTQRVIRQTSVPVLAVRPETDTIRHLPQEILVPTDGSSAAKAAIDRAVAIPSAEEVTLHLLSVIDAAAFVSPEIAHPHIDALEEHAAEIVEEGAARARAATDDTVTETTERSSSVHGAIQRYIEANDVDRVVMGTHGRTGVRRYLLGSTTEKTLRTATVPVLVVPDS